MKIYFNLFLLLWCTSHFYAQELRILYFNDAHELAPVYFNGEQVGGIAKVAHLIEKRRDSNTMVLFGGDLAGGTLGGKIFKGTVMVKALNEIGIDIANPGQHEFDHGLDHFIQLKHQSNFPWISSNLIYPEDTALFLPYKIVEKNQLKVGVIGLTDKINTSQPGLPLKERDMVQAAQQIISKHLEVHIWIAITQMDMPKNLALHAAVPQIDLILTEETYHDKTQIVWHNKTPMVAASGNAGDVVEVNFLDGEKHIQVHALRLESLEDPSMQAWISDALNLMEKRLDKKLTHALEPFSKEETKFGERAIGNLVADAFLAYYNADLAIVQGGGIRAGLPKGDITLKDAYAVLPFNNWLVLAQLSGQEIKNILNTSLARMVPQIAGITFKIGGTEENPYVKEVYFKGELLKDHQQYTVSLPSYIADGGGDYVPIDASKILKREIIDANAFIWYLQNKKQVKPLIERRISH